MFRRFLLTLLISSMVILPTIGQDKDKEKKEEPKVEKKEDKKPEEKKPEEKKPEEKKPEEKKPEEKKETPKAGSDKSVLKWKLDKDKKFYQKMVTETKQNMKVMNNDVVQNQKQTFYFEWNPEKQDGDIWTIVQKIIGVAMDIDIGSQKIAYDSTDAKTATGNPLADFFKALIDSSFTIKLNTKDMKVTDVDGQKEFVAKLVTANQAMKPLLEQILSKKALQDMAEPTFAAIPGKEVAKGDKWKRETTLDMGPIGKYDNTYEYTYEGKDKDGKLDRISVVSSLKYKEPGEIPGGAGQGLPFKIKKADLKSSNAKGVILFDPEKGQVVKSDMELDLTGSLTIEIGGQSTDVALSQKQTSAVTTTSENPIPKK